MLIKKRRIRSLKANLPTSKEGDRVVVGVQDLGKRERVLRKMGFENMDIGESVLPKPAFGPISEFNAVGKNEPQKDKPKETAYRTTEWSWEQWRGRDTVTRSKIVDVPYKRYPRIFISPPSVELKIADSAEGNRILVSPCYEIGSDDEELVHVINLFLEIFGQCRIYSSNLDQIIKTKAKRLNWRVLPEGKRPWEDLESELSPLISQAPEGNQGLIWKRFETINDRNPEFLAIGNAGFAGYVIFGFSGVDAYILESIYYGNATYVLGSDWELISKLSKAEILDDDLHEERFIHRADWYQEMEDFLDDLLN